jgi:hypothetical protein
MASAADSGKEEQSAGTVDQKSRLPTWLGHFGYVQVARYPKTQFSFFVVKNCSNLDCYITLALLFSGFLMVKNHFHKYFCFLPK